MSINALKLAQEIMQQRSVSGEVDEGALDVLQAALESLGFVCTRLPFSHKGTYDVDNLYARLGTAQPNICFAGHTDVVPVGDEAAWSHDPFGSEIVDGVLYGRGAVDMKASIACFVAAASEYLQEEGQPKGSISLLITGDEEATAINGTVKMLQWLKKNNEQVDACIVGEPTNPEALGDMIKIGRRGSLSFDLTVQGVQGHVAYPALADNPITPMTNILHRLVNTPLDAGTEHFPPTNLEIVSVDVGNPASNIIPAHANAKGNIRFNDTYDRDSLIAWVKAHVDAITDSYTLSFNEGCECFLTPPGKLSEVVAGAVREVTGRDPKLSTDGGTSDARFIKDICPVVECGLINKTAHKVDEHIAVADVEQLAVIYKAVLTRFFA